MAGSFDSTKRYEIAGLSMTGRLSLLWPCMVAALCFAVENTSVAAQAARAEDREIGTVVEQFLARLQVGDRTALDELVTADFYAFDAGMRMNFQQLFTTVTNARVAGRVFTWSVTSLRVDARTDIAFAAWCNVGTIADGDRTQPQRWLESAVLERAREGWRISFLHSTRQAAGRKVGDDCDI